LEEIVYRFTAEQIVDASPRTKSAGLQVEHHLQEFPYPTSYGYFGSKGKQTQGWKSTYEELRR
jgi:hypothetical protein